MSDVFFLLQNRNKVVSWGFCGFRFLNFHFFSIFLRSRNLKCDLKMTIWSQKWSKTSKKALAKNLMEHQATKITPWPCTHFENDPKVKILWFWNFDLNRISHYFRTFFRFFDRSKLYFHISKKKNFHRNFARSHRSEILSY